MAANDTHDKPVYVLTPVALGIAGGSMARYGLAFLRRRLLVLAFGILGGAAIGGAYAYFATQIYRNEVVLAPAVEDNPGSLDSVVSKFGSLGALAGLGGQADTQTKEALAVLKSDGFISDFVVANELRRALFAERWDGKRAAWSVSADDIPSVADAVKRFRDDVFTVIDDAESGVVRLRVEWSDRALASNWANVMVATLNNTIRLRTAEEATRSVAYLQAELDRTQSVSLRQALFELLEQQEKRKMLAAVRMEYAFRVLDAARVRAPDDIERPKRLLVTIMSALCGLFLSVLFGVLRDLNDPRIQNRA